MNQEHCECTVNAQGVCLKPVSSSDVGSAEKFALAMINLHDAEMFLAQSVHILLHETPRNPRTNNNPLTYFYFAKGKQHCSQDNFADGRNLWGLQVSALGHLSLQTANSPSRDSAFHSPPPLFFFPLSQEAQGTLQAPTWGASATLGACVNQSPERRGAAARARAGGRGEAEAASAAAGRKSGGGGKERPRQKEREAAQGLVQARPLRGDQEAGAALDNQHAEMLQDRPRPLVSSCHVTSQCCVVFSKVCLI
ncbi:uncharacterized protein LOC132536307 [Erinaceus europaeus]|uniref:Uncharacterized protein LOC132536307 n=1 Tax=Erinaceus europaeus TaxID=9365 RepID=A0ABM3WTM0_ERIEU|nr:uncharacterized protein LOC132536307 [Erinaceus europaeus]